MRRIVYFLYYLKKLNKPLFKKFFKHVKQETNHSNLFLYFDIIKNSLKYNISILEYFQFHFYEISEEEKKEWAGTGYMYEFQKYMNPPKYRYLLEDKTVFDKTYEKYIHHSVVSINDLKEEKDLANKILSNPSGKIVFKIKDGGCGRGIIVESASSYKNADEIIEFMETNNFDLVEEFVQQHEIINKISSSALNTVRIITQLRSDGNVDIVGCRLRISVNGVTDNLAAGNIATYIDPETGMITGKGVYSDITKKDCEIHPISGENIIGIKIPFWEETIKLIKEIAIIDKRNRSIGWDLAITSYGPDLIEGNREWCKLLYQLPAKKGLKSTLEKYIKE